MLYYRPALTEDLIRRLFARDYTWRQMEALTRLKFEALRSAARRWGLRKPIRNRPILGNQPEEIRRLVSLGLTKLQIARRLDVCESTVAIRMKENKIAAYKQEPSIPDCDRDKVAALIAAGWLEREIGEACGCDQHSVSRYLVRHGIPASNGRGRKRSDRDQPPPEPYPDSD